MVQKIIEYLYLDTTEPENSYHLTDGVIIEYIDEDDCLAYTTINLKTKYAAPLRGNNRFSSISELMKNSKKLKECGVLHKDAQGWRTVLFPCVIEDRKETNV